jgi:streptogramin lyase
MMLFATMLLASTPLQADTTTITEPPRLWVAASSAVHQFRPESPAFDLQLPGTQGAKALALDPGTRQMWLRTQEAMGPWIQIPAS